jgi:hypothetical protein
MGDCFKSDLLAGIASSRGSFIFALADCNESAYSDANKLRGFIRI